MGGIPAPAEPSASEASARILASIAVGGPVFYIVLVTVLGVLREGYDPIRDTQSELGAVDSPSRVLMNVAGFMGLGASILAFAGAYHIVLRKSRAKVLATGLLAIAGLGMVVVGFFPCDAGCVDMTSTGRLHGTFSMPGAIGLPLQRAGMWPPLIWMAAVSFKLSTLSVRAAPT